MTRNGPDGYALPTPQLSRGRKVHAYVNGGGRKGHTNMNFPCSYFRSGDVYTFADGSAVRKVQGGYVVEGV